MPTATTPSFDHVFRLPWARRRGVAAARPHEAARRSIRHLVRRLNAGQICCGRNCLQEHFASPEARAAVASWRRGWASLRQKERRDTLCEFFTQHLRSVGGVDGVNLVKYSFLKRQVCLAAWHVLTGVGASTRADARKRAGLGEVEWQPKLRPRASPTLDAIHGALWSLIMNMRERMPLARSDLDGIVMPFAKKKQLYHMLLAWYEEREADPSRPALLVRRPCVKTFWMVLRRPEFEKVRFHRVVDMGRCPKCCFYNWKVLSVGAAHREMWAQLAAKHQWLQLAQKRCYAMDRASAAFNFPEAELYMAMDAGSGYNAVLPHLSPWDVEGPNKALKEMSALPMKVMNGLVHGDHRSHVILSPGSVVAGGNHTCESIMILVNTCLLDHGTLPRQATVQLDNASTNKCMLVLAFMGVYCVHGVFEQARVRFCLEHHAHDIYDAFHAIHSKALYQHTFFEYEEMIAVIKGAHVAARDRHAREGGGTHPIMGHDVQVSNLWQLRDIWEWLAPGYRKDKDTAWVQASFVSYEKIPALPRLPDQGRGGWRRRREAHWPLGQAVHVGRGLPLRWDLADRKDVQGHSWAPDAGGDGDRKQRLQGHAGDQGAQAFPCADGGALQGAVLGGENGGCAGAADA